MMAFEQMFQKFFKFLSRLKKKTTMHSCFSAFDYSGGYFNPALATSLKYGCLGTTFMEHVIVYWIGACAGSVLSLQVYRLPTVQDFIQRQKEKAQ